MSCGYKSLHTDRGGGGGGGGDIFCVGRPVCIGIGFGVNIGAVLFAPHLMNLLTDFNQFCMDFTLIWTTKC